MEQSELQLVAKLAQKIRTVMEGVTSIPKRGENTHFKYSFVTEADALEAVRTKCVEVGLVILPGVVQATCEGKRTRVTLTYTYIDTETGYAYTLPWAAEADDSQDKGINKAIVSGGKYHLLKAFMIPSGEDPDAQGEVQQKEKPKSQTKAAKQAESDREQYDRIVTELGLTDEHKAELKGRTGLGGREFAVWLIAQSAAGAKGFMDLYKVSAPASNGVTEKTPEALAV